MRSRNTQMKKIPIFEAFPLYKKALAISFKTKTKFSLFISIIGFAMAFLPFFISLVLRNFTDSIQNLYQSGASNIHATIGIFLLLSLLYITQNIFSAINNYCNVSDTMRAQHYIKESVLKYSTKVKYKYIDNFDDFRGRIFFADTYTGYRVAGSMQLVIVWLQRLITFFSLVYLLGNINVWIVIVLIITCIPAIVLSYKQKDDEYRHNVKWMKEGALVVHYFHNCCDIECINEVRFFGIFDFLKQKWRNTANHYIKKKNKMTRKHVLYNSVSDFLRNSVYIIILLITVFEIIENPTIGIGTFMLVLTTAGDLQRTTSDLFIKAAQFAGDKAFMKDFFSLEDLEMEAVDVDDTIKPIKNIDIRFDNINFSYPNSDSLVLKNMNITINQGEKIAIVGKNGSGKTSFINLLCGLYEPSTGSVLMNDLKIQDDIRMFRNNISAIFQNFGRYETSLGENISLSDYTKELNLDELDFLTKQVGAYDFIMDQPDGYNEIIGSFNEKGNNLSGGQWQKIAIARALFRNKSRIVILDEPTAALDPLSEAELYRNFTELTGDKTVLLVSHRLGITSLVDRILVFDNGVIVEDGNHFELMEHDGLYAEMYRAQAQWYHEKSLLPII